MHVQEEEEKQARDVTQRVRERGSRRPRRDDTREKDEIDS